MPKSANEWHREMRKKRHGLPGVPAPGHLSMSRKSIRSAAKYIAAADRLWGRGRVNRKARKHALRRQDAAAASPRRHHLDKAVRLRMLGAMSGWIFDQRSKAFVPKDDSPERLEELLDAVTDLRSEVIVLRVSGLSQWEAARVRGYLQAGSALIVVNHRTCEPAFIYADRP